MTDRRGEEHVPQFYGRNDEKFAEWEIDVKLWEAEYKEDDRDRRGPKLCRRGLHGQPKIVVKTKLGTQDASQFTVDNIIQCLKNNGCGELPEELGQEALDNYFDVRQDDIFREEILTVALKKDTALDLDENQRILAHENVEPHGSRSYWHEDHHSGADKLAQIEGDHPHNRCKETRGGQR